MFSPWSSRPPNWCPRRLLRPALLASKSRYGIARHARILFVKDLECLFPALAAVPISVFKKLHHLWRPLLRIAMAIGIASRRWRIRFQTCSGVSPGASRLSRFFTSRMPSGPCFMPTSSRRSISGNHAALEPFGRPFRFISMSRTPHLVWSAVPNSPLLNKGASEGKK